MILRRIQVCLLSALLLSASALTAKQNLSFEVHYEETVAGNHIEVVMRQKEFNFSEYKLTGGTEGSDESAKINGVEIAGTDGQSPAKWAGWPTVKTIAEIELKWDGKRIPVSKLLHINLLGLALGSVKFIPRPSGEELLIQAVGGDGGASYLVSLVLRKNGKHKQYEAGYCEDGMRPYPYMVEEAIKMPNGEVRFHSFPWLTPEAKPAPVPDGGK